MRRLLVVVLLSLASAAGAQTPGIADTRPTPIFNGGDVRVRGGLEVRRVKQVVRRDWRALRACYVDALTGAPALQGDLLLRFVIMPDGSVGNAGFDQVGDALAPVANCIRERALQWRFPTRASGTVVVTYPFSVAPGAAVATGDPAVRAPHPPVPRIRPGAVVRGSLDRAVIQRVIRRHMAEVRYCYERQLATAPALEGTVHLRFTIQASGHVDQASVENVPEGMELVARCLEGRARRWRFPEPAGGGIVIVAYPFAFRPG